MFSGGQFQVLDKNTYKISVENRFFALFYTHMFRFFNFWAIFQPILKIPFPIDECSI